MISHNKHAMHGASPRAVAQPGSSTGCQPWCNGSETNVFAKRERYFSLSFFSNRARMSLRNCSSNDFPHNHLSFSRRLPGALGCCLTR